MKRGSRPCPHLASPKAGFPEARASISACCLPVFATIFVKHTFLFVFINCSVLTSCVEFFLRNVRIYFFNPHTMHTHV